MCGGRKGRPPSHLPCPINVCVCFEVVFSPEGWVGEWTISPRPTAGSLTADLPSPFQFSLSILPQICAPFDPLLSKSINPLSPLFCLLKVNFHPSNLFPFHSATPHTQMPPNRPSSAISNNRTAAILPIFCLLAFSLLLNICPLAIGQKVNVTLFTESQCPFCTRLLREQIWQFHSRHPGVMNLQIIPFGKGNCEFTRDRRLICKCMHGPTECDLNRLQNCAISYFPRRHIGLVICIQGLKNLDDAYRRCLSRLSPRTQNRLKQCAQTQTGEVLNYYSMLNTHRAGVRIWPTAYVNGHFFDRSYPMEVKICEHTDWC